MEPDPGAGDGEHGLDGLLGTEDVGDERERDVNGVVVGIGGPDEAVGCESEDARLVGRERWVGFRVGLNVHG